MKCRLFPGNPLCVQSISPPAFLCLPAVVHDSALPFIQPPCFSPLHAAVLQGCRSTSFVCPLNVTHLFLDTGLCHSLPDAKKYRIGSKKKRKKMHSRTLTFQDYSANCNANREAGFGHPRSWYLLGLCKRAACCMVLWPRRRISATSFSPCRNQHCAACTAGHESQETFHLSHRVVTTPTASACFCFHITWGGVSAGQAFCFPS